jgi:hypothetical protein
MPDFKSLKSILAQSKVKKDDALYKTVVGIIDKLTKVQFPEEKIKAVARTGGNAQNSTPPPTPVDVNASRTYLTVNDERLNLPNSRRLVAGTGILFDDTVAGQRTISALTGCYVPVSTGAEPLEIMSDGAGHVLLVGFNV